MSVKLKVLCKSYIIKAQLLRGVTRKRRTVQAVAAVILDGGEVKRME